MKRKLYSVRIDGSVFVRVATTARDEGQIAEIAMSRIRGCDHVEMNGYSVLEHAPILEIRKRKEGKS